jgi:hypothetical protein
MPSDIKSLVEQRKREEQEKLEKADEEARKLGVSFDTGTKTRKSSKIVETDGETAPDSAISTDETDAGKSDNNPTPNAAPRDEPPPISKPVTSTTPAKNPEPPTEKPKDEGSKRKGKKGDG